MSLTYDETALTLVNTAERIAVQRVDIFGDPAHPTVATKGESWAYAWEQGKTLQQMERVVWVDSLPDGTKVNAWLQLSNYSKKWDPSLQKFVAR